MKDLPWPNSIQTYREKSEMGSISTQSIFQSSTSDRSDRSWRSYVGSIVVHAVLVLLALTITIPVMRPVRRPTERVTLVAPVLSEYKAKITPPVPVHARAPIAPLVPKPTSVPPKALEVTVPKPLPPKPAIVAAAPEINVPSIPPPVQLKPELPAAPKPPVQTGVFQQSVDVAKNTPPAKLVVGGFGDPPSANTKPGLAPAKVGAFDAASGSGANHGHNQAAVKEGAFGNATMAGNTRVGGAVKSAGFDETAQLHKKTLDPNAAQALTPVEVLSKPRPAYTTEARNLKIEGHVSLEVVFLANGSIRVVRVVHGLGHGLDEAAEQAAMQVRFKPATRGGVPVDTDATIDITFELT
jgi:TonB family protein